jgi:hypothetical protein
MTDDAPDTEERPHRLYTGWALDTEDRKRLLEAFPPAYPDVVADHVTFGHPALPDAILPTAREGRVVGRVDDGEGVQALVVEIEGTTDRPDGSTYHLTWSLDRARGREGRDSNDVLARLGWTPLPEPIPIRLEPRLFGQ